MVHMPVSTLKVRISAFMKRYRPSDCFVSFISKREKHCIVFYVCTGAYRVGRYFLVHYLSILDEVKQMDLLFKNWVSETFFFFSFYSSRMPYIRGVLRFGIY